VVLDLKKPAAREALLRLTDGADVFMHNMRVGAAQRLGLDYESLRQRNPGLVYASASGFRKGSSMQEFPAYDDLIQGLSGIASLNAGPDGAPRYFPTVIVDKLTGTVLASMIGMALFHRERTGEGQEVHVPMLETILSFTLIEQTRPGIMGIWGNDGTVSKEDRRRCIQLLCSEVMPAVREHGKSLGLKDPWEANAPVHLRYSTDIPRQRVAAE
jgi:crotonobetainyl-CoA:carnitine CoA-transferase CaiB-like acyl-CoA transferase